MKNLRIHLKKKNSDLIKKQFNTTSTTLTTKDEFLLSQNNFLSESFLKNVKENEKKIDLIKNKLGLNHINYSHSKYFHTEPSLLLNNKKEKYIKPEIGEKKRKNSLIPFTKIKSPISSEGRELNLYKKIFYFFQDHRKKYARDIKIINNKLNIEYANDEEHFEKKLIKHNLELIKKGEKIKHFTGPTFEETQLKDLQKKVKFMKSVVDYTYPDMVLFKVKQTDKRILIKNRSRKILEPFKICDYNHKLNQNMLFNYLNSAISISKS